LTELSASYFLLQAQLARKKTKETDFELIPGLPWRMKFSVTPADSIGDDKGLQRVLPKGGVEGLKGVNKSAEWKVENVHRIRIVGYVDGGTVPAAFDQHHLPSVLLRHTDSVLPIWTKKPKFWRVEVTAGQEPRKDGRPVLLTKETARRFCDHLETLFAKVDPDRVVKADRLLSAAIQAEDTLNRRYEDLIVRMLATEPVLARVDSSVVDRARLNLCLEQLRRSARAILDREQGKTSGLKLGVDSSRLESALADCHNNVLKRFPDVARAMQSEGNEDLFTLARLGGIVKQAEIEATECDAERLKLWANVQAALELQSDQ
jgi:hypothetical protein